MRFIIAAVYPLVLSFATLCAEITADGWGVIIAAFFLGLTQILAMILSHLRATAVATKVEEVRIKQAETVAESRAEAANVVAKVEEVKTKLDDTVTAITKNGHK